MRPIESSHGALADLRVLELGTRLAGQFCAQILGDMGAEAIKIGAPNQGDPMGVWGRHDEAHGLSLWWPVVSRNKKSITLDLRQTVGIALPRKDRSWSSS